MDIKTLLLTRQDPTEKFLAPKQKNEIVQIKGYRNGLQRIDGIFMPHMFRNRSVVKNMEMRDDDTFVVTYPKSGTNWVAEIVWLIKNKCDIEAANAKHHMSRSSFIDMGWTNDVLNEMTSPRVFQTHLRLEFLPDNIENRAKIIYVTRNPKDVIVSLYFFLKKIPEDQFDGTMEELLEDFVKGEVVYDSWWNHVNQFTKLDNIHIVHFEDLLEDSINETRKLAKFLGHDLTDEQVKCVVDFCSFDKLKNSRAFEMKPDKAEGEATASDEKGEKMKELDEIKLFRKGQIGDWKNYFTEEMSKQIDEMNLNKLAYKKPYRFEPSK